MTWLSLDELDAQADDFDDHVQRTPEIDTFCSSSSWVLPAARSAAPNQRALIRRTDAGFVALLSLNVGHGLIGAVPLEFGWGLAAPFAGEDPDRLVGLLARMWTDASPRVNVLILSGLQVDGVWWRAITRRFIDRYRIGLGEICDRRIASLQGGLDGFLSRRSGKFRANLRRAEKRRLEQGVEVDYQPAVPVSEIYDRILRVEEQSWKGRVGEGFNEGIGRDFYERILSRLSKRGQLRVLFLTQEGRDVAFVFGALVGAHYRGLQVSFIDDKTELSLGNLAQYQLIQRLISEGALRYDLGTDMDYKARWAEEIMSTRQIIVLR